MRYTLEELCTKKENQVFDRKSARKDAKGLSNHIVALSLIHISEPTRPY